MARVSKTQGKKINDALAAGISSKKANRQLKKTEAAFGALRRGAVADSEKIREALAQGVNTKPIAAGLDKVESEFEKVRRVGTKTPAELAKAQKTLVGQQRKTNKATKGWSEQLRQARLKVAAVVVGVGLLTNALTKNGGAYLDFRKGIAEVNTLLNLNDSGIGALASDVRQLSEATGSDVQNNVEALYNIVSAGATESSEANLVLAASIKAAIAGVTDTNTSASGIISVLNAYKRELTDVTDVSDVMFTTVRLGVTTFEQLSANLGQVLPSAVGAKVPLEEVTAAIAEMTKAGIRTPIASTALRGAINSLVAPTTEAQGALADYGIEWRGFTETIGDIARLNLNPAQLRAIVPDVEARNAVQSLTNNYQGLLDTLDQMQNSSGATGAALQIIQDTDSHKVDLMRAAYRELKLEIGAMVAAGTPVIEMITSLITKISDMDTATGSLLVSVPLLTGILYAFSRGIGAATFAWATFAPLFLTSGGLIAGVTIAMAAGFVALVAGTAAGIAGIVGLTNAIADANLAENEATQNQIKRISNLRRLEILNRNNAKVEQLSAEALASLTDEERATYGQRLETARNYWRARFELGVADGANENDPNIQEAFSEARSFSQRLSAYQTYVQQRQQQTAELAQQLAKHKQAHDALTESIKSDLEELIEANKKRVTELSRELDKGVQAEQAANDKIKRLRNELAGIEQSTADKVRALRRRDLTDTEKQADLQAQSVEKITAARRALRKGDTGGANALAGQAQALASQIDATDRAVRITQAAGKLLEKSKQKEIVATRAAAAEHKKANIDLRAEIEKSKAELVSMQQTLTEIGKGDIAPEVTIKGIDKALKDLDALSKKIDQVNRKQANINSGVQTRRHGGPVFANTGKQLPGYGGGDKVPVMAEAGEWIINKERSRRFGSLLNAINFGSLDSVQAMISQFAFTPKFEIGGVVPGAVPSAAPALAGAGDSFGPTGDTVNLSIDLGGSRRFDLFGQRDQVNDFVAALESVSRG